MDSSRLQFTEHVDLASERVGGRALQTSDDFFAAKEGLLKYEKAIFIPDKYTDRGKWMDGWESRRKRTPGHDWCIVQLGLPGIIRGINVDTSHFLGNYPEYCSLEAAALGPNEDAAAAKWNEIVPKSALHGGTDNLFPVSDTSRWTHVRLNIFPDGGVARLRIHGEVKPDWTNAKKALDLAAIENGGIVVACNDMFFGKKDNLIMPGKAKTMGDGWETRRRRRPGNDWLIVKLGTQGRLKRLEIDTSHFKGNFPDSCSVEACLSPGPDFSSVKWITLLPKTKLQADHLHVFEKEIADKSSLFDHVRLQIYPDGGIARFRVIGERV